MPVDPLRHVSPSTTCLAFPGLLTQVGMPLEVWMWEEQLDWEMGPLHRHPANLDSNPRTCTSPASPALGSLIYKWMG